MEKAKYQAKRIIEISPDIDFADSIVIGTLQGVIANKSDEQIAFNIGAYEVYKEYIKEHFECGFSDRDENGEKWSAASLLTRFADILPGYILAKDATSEGTSVAVSVAGQLCAVVLTEKYIPLAEKLGLKMLLDARKLDDSWLRSSEYWKNINHDVAVEQPAIAAPKLVDYAVMSGAYFSFYNGTDRYAHTKKYEYLRSGAVIIGWNSILGEYDTVDSCGRINICLVPADHAYNLSTLSGFNVDNLKQNTKDLASKQTENHHTVCFIMSDGDNLQWVLNGFCSEKWYGSPIRGEFPMSWGLPGTSAEVAAPMVGTLYEKMSLADEFILQLSGIGYTFPSRWDRSELEKMAEKLSAAMAGMNIKYAEILDDKAFVTDTFDPFTKQEGIDGIFYIDYWNYAGEKGKMLWSNGKPVVSARYRLWADTPDGAVRDGNVESVAEAINCGKRDPFSPEGYSFVIVHCWSGLDKNGKLVPDGDTMAAVKAVIDRLSLSVDVVTASEFMRRIKKNLAE